MAVTLSRPARLAALRRLRRGPAAAGPGRRAGPGSCTSDSARSTGPTRPSTPRRRSPPPAATGASSAVAPRSAATWSDALAAQDDLFSVTSRSTRRRRPPGWSARWSASGTPPSDPAAVVALLADPAIRVVTLTVTEKAYRLDPATGRLRPDAALVADLTGERPPRRCRGCWCAGWPPGPRADAGAAGAGELRQPAGQRRRLRGLVDQALADRPRAAPGRDWVPATSPSRAPWWTGSCRPARRQTLERGRGRARRHRPGRGGGRAVPRSG